MPPPRPQVRPGLRHGQPYQAYWCEENVWQLALRTGDPDALVWVLTNEERTFAMWEQVAAADGGLLFWDYHVVLARPGASSAPPERGTAQAAAPRWEVWDLDTRLGFPCPAGRWLSRSFPKALSREPTLIPLFRVIPVDVWLSRFSSDRSHMRVEGGAFQAPPPPWAPIQPEASNLARLLDPEDPFLGPLLTLDQALERFR